MKNTKNIRYRYHQLTSEQGLSAGEALEILLQGFAVSTVKNFVVELPTNDLNVMLLTTNNQDIENAIFETVEKRKEAEEGEDGFECDDPNEGQDDEDYNEGDWEREHSRNLYG